MFNIILMSVGVIRERFKVVDFRDVLIQSKSLSCGSVDRVFSG